MKRVAAGAYLPTLDYLSMRNARTIEPSTAWTAGSSSSASTGYSFFTLEWSGAHPMGEHWQELGPMSIPS